MSNILCYVLSAFFLLLSVDAIGAEHKKTIQHFIYKNSNYYNLKNEIITKEDANQYKWLYPNNSIAAVINAINTDILFQKDKNI